MDNHTLQQVIDLAVKTAVLKAKKEAILECRPVGSYFITETEDDPNVLFGGGWEKLTGRYVLQCSDDTHKAGTTVEAGLPDIGGNAVITDNVCVNTTSSFVFGGVNGCFSVSGSGPRAVTTNVSVATHADNRTLTFRASKSNQIYGNSDTVQPPARIVNVWKRVS